MAGETLKNAAQLLADYPDNTLGLIQAVNVRNHVIADGNDIGFVEEGVPYSLTLPAGVPTNILADASAPSFVGRFWALDGNRELIQSYAADGVPVSAGVSRIVTFSMQALVSQAGGGTTDYLFQIFIGGVASGSGVTVTLSVDDELIDFRRTVLYDCVTPLPLSFRVSQAAGTALEVDVVSIQTLGVLI